MTSEPDVELDPGERAVRDWRVERFVGLGVPFDDATELAGRGVSWHEAERLVAAGCPPASVARIV